MSRQLFSQSLLHATRVLRCELKQRRQVEGDST